MCWMCEFVNLAPEERYKHVNRNLQGGKDGVLYLNPEGQELELAHFNHDIQAIVKARHAWMTYAILTNKRDIRKSDAAKFGFVTEGLADG